MTIQENTVAAFHYTLTLASGEIADSSEGREPLKVLIGGGQIIPGLENELIGMAVGDKKDVTVQPADGYGVREDDMIQTVPASELPDSIKKEVGEMIEAQTTDGHVIHGQISKVEGGNVDIDFNHPLAGEVLTFAVEITDIREASSEEIDHGHVH